MTEKVIGAVVSYVDPRYPIIIESMTEWNKLSRDEAINLVGELLDAVNKLDSDQYELKKAA